MKVIDNSIKIGGVYIQRKKYRKNNTGYNNKEKKRW
jgi:hypothetical protein